MKHKISKVKIKNGSDANQMLMKKLVRNFVASGTLKTTMTKALYLKSAIESLSHHALSYNEATKNVLLPYFNTLEQVNKFVEISKKRTMNDTGSGIVKILKLGERAGDAAPIGKVVWSKVIEEPKKEVKKIVKTKSK
jgi:ribosomal protein L17